ncbi:MepB family protein [Enterococcus gallinarum]|nr:MepB family protein [Enterococcus gallinarum]MCW3745193.1 MepB family protein [Enterococcus gallinarum]
MTALLKMHHIAGPTKIQTERQNSVYEGMTFVVGNTTFRSRLAKKTPKKKAISLHCGSNLMKRIKLIH